MMVRRVVSRPLKLIKTTGHEGRLALTELTELLEQALA
jgi:hypothetical protein